MKVEINNFIEMNDWNFRSFIIVILSLLLAFWGSIFLDLLGFYIPLLRQIIAFLIISLIPGLLILRILQVHNIGTLMTILYSIGISLAIIMFTGFLINLIYPILGYYNPISFWPLMVTLTLIITLLSVLAWIRDRNYSAPGTIKINEFISPLILFLSIIPFGAIFGTYLMNLYGINFVQLLILPIIAFIPLILVYTNKIPVKYYPYCLYCLTIVLIFHTTLISRYVWGWDIQYEYYLVHNVLQNSYWNYNIASNCNAMLSLVSIGPFYSILLGIDLDLTLKIIYPFFFSLVPLGLYSVFQTQISQKMAFLASFLFISLNTFYFEMLALARQEIAELFFILIILIFINNSISKIQQYVLLFLFSASLIVSHYGLSYIFLVLLICAIIISKMQRSIQLRKIKEKLLALKNKNKKKFFERIIQNKSNEKPLISLLFFIWFITFQSIWYLYLSSSSNFETITILTHRIMKNFYSDIFNPDKVQGLAIIVYEAASPLREFTKYLYIIVNIFIIIGFSIVLLRRDDFIQIKNNYLYLSIGALFICICSITLPYFASALNTSRLFQISLILLALFSIIGMNTFIFMVKRPFLTNNSILSIIAIFLGIFLLFNCGWFYEINHEESYFNLNKTVDSPVFYEQEVLSSNWLKEVKDSRPVSADRYRQLVLTRSLGPSSFKTLQTMIDDDIDCYIYLGRNNIYSDQIILHQFVGVTPIIKKLKITNINYDKNLIYNNGDSRISLNDNSIKFYKKY